MKKGSNPTMAGENSGSQSDDHSQRAPNQEPNGAGAVAQGGTAATNPDQIGGKLRHDPGWRQRRSRLCDVLCIRDGRL